MGEFVHAFLLGSIAYLVLSIRFKGEFSRSWKIILTVFIAFFCIMMLRSGQWGSGAFLRTTGCALAFVIFGIVHYCIKGRTEPDTTILQCPKCLEVQPRSDVCIKCGLNLRKCKPSDPLYSANTEDEFERMDPRIEKFMNNSALIYLLAAAFISIFNIGNLEISKYYCEVVKSLVPSLYGTSVISIDPNNTCLILALSWTWPIVTAGLMIKWLINQQVNDSVSRFLPQGKLFLKLLMSLILMAAVVGLYFRPIIPFKEPLILSEKIIDMLIRNWTFGSALWGLGIYYTIIVLAIIVMTLVLEFIDNWGK
jgi:hypothetical protein